MKTDNQTQVVVDSPPAARVVVVIPAFNEERFIASMVLKALRFSPTVIVVDDGSQDDTARLAEAAGAQVLRLPVNQGKGAALRAGFQAAAGLVPAAVVMLDADGQHRPEDLDRVVAPILEHRADIVIGSRYLQGADGVPQSRVWGHRLFNLLTRAAAGVGSSDSQSGFRAFSPAALDVMALHSNGFSVESEMQFVAREHQLRIEEVPVTIRYLDKPKRSVWQHGLLVLNGILRLMGQMRPLLFFGGSGAVVLLVGAGLGVLVVDIYSRTRQLAVGYAMLSVLLTIIGMLGLSTGIILHSVRGLLIDFNTRHTDQAGSQH